MKTIADRVRWARKKRGHSCAALDREADITVGHVAKIERGTAPSSTTIEKLAKALDVDPSWLMFGGGRPTL